MNRKVQYGEIAGVVVALLVAYYAIPLGLAIITLGEVCAYSPLGIPLCASPERHTICKEPGIRYVGETTVLRNQVCFTLTADRRNWVEIGFGADNNFNNCPDATGERDREPDWTYYKRREPLTRPGLIRIPGFTATIRDETASGVLRDTKYCGSRTFKWTARRKS